MKIHRVVTNNRKRGFEIDTRRQSIFFPYAKADPAPSSADRVREVYVDPELGNEAFTYALESGAEGSVHIDAVLDYNRDPDYLASLVVHELSAEARTRLEESPLAHREILRRLDTSASQLYRLVNPKNTRKSMRQVLALLHVLDCEVSFTITPRREGSRQRKKGTPRKTSRTVRARR